MVALGALVADENEIYDLTNIGTLSAFAIVCIGVLVLRYTEPDRPRPFRVPLVWAVSLLGAFACFYTMLGLPRTAWERFGIWLVIGALIYAFYGYRHSPAAPEAEIAGTRPTRVRMVVSDHSEIPHWVLWRTTGLRCAAPAFTTSRISTSICRATSWS